MEELIQLKTRFEEKVTESDGEAIQMFEDELRFMLKMVESKKKEIAPFKNKDYVTVPVERLKKLTISPDDETLPTEVARVNPTAPAEKETKDSAHVKLTNTQYHYQRVDVWTDFFSNEEVDVDDRIRVHGLSRDSFYRGRHLKAAITSYVLQLIKVTPAQLEFLEEFVAKLKDVNSHEGFLSMQDFVQSAGVTESVKGKATKFFSTVGQRFSQWAKQQGEGSISRNHFPYNNKEAMNEIKALRSPLIRKKDSYLLLGSGLNVLRAATHASLKNGKLLYDYESCYLGSLYREQDGDSREILKKLEEVGTIEKITLSEIL